MAGTDEADEVRLAGRMPKSPPRDASDEIDDDVPDDQEIEAVNRLMGFLRGTDDA